MELLVSDIKSDTLPEDEKATAEKDFEDSMKQISLQISRCAKITQAILKFGRQDEPKFQKMDLKTFIPEIMQMVEKKAKVNGISLVRDFTKDTPEIEGDPAQLQQVLLNLFNNAFDAISDARGNSGGNVLIKTSSENGHVTISVKDNGSGISDENMEKIFSPFFTTKPVGKGTGLGLSVCYGIIENMGGSIKVNSEKNKGTEFIIELPASLNKKA